MQVRHRRRRQSAQHRQAPRGWDIRFRGVPEMLHAIRGAVFAAVMIGIVAVGGYAAAQVSGVFDFSNPGTLIVPKYAPSITPAATAAAIGTSSQTFTVTGLTTADRVYVNGPAPTALCPMVGARVSAANTLQLDFATLTAVACTPAAG